MSGINFDDDMMDTESGSQATVAPNNKPNRNFVTTECDKENEKPVTGWVVCEWNIEV